MPFIAMSSPLPTSGGDAASLLSAVKPASPTLSDTELELELEDGLALEEEDATICPLCSDTYKQPRVLACLHVFCNDCLIKQLDHSDDELEPADSVSVDKNASGCNKIVCAICQQETEIPEKGIEDLPLDSVLISQINAKNGLENLDVVCTSCKAKEKAVARCMDCANFLCPNCVTAHQYMRCFENHKVSCLDNT